jgi:opacity protein-like surface antigen
MRKLAIIFLSLVAFFMISIDGNAAGEFSRRNKIEIFAFGQQMNGDETSASDFDFEAEFDDTIVGGIGIGFNFHDHLNLNMDMFFGSTDLILRGYGITAEADTDLFGMDLNLDYNILKSRFTPMITGGIGFIYFSSDKVSSGGNEASVDADEADFSYNIGAGFRWDITDHFLMKGIYRFTWTKMDDTDDRLMFDGVTLSIGYVF